MSSGRVMEAVYAELSAEDLLSFGYGFVLVKSLWFRPFLLVPRNCESWFEVEGLEFGANFGSCRVEG